MESPQETEEKGVLTFSLTQFIKQLLLVIVVHYVEI